jgi:hypothetical protein
MRKPVRTTYMAWALVHQYRSRLNGNSEPFITGRYWTPDAIPSFMLGHRVRLYQTRREAMRDRDPNLRGNRQFVTRVLVTVRELAGAIRRRR